MSGRAEGLDRTDAIEVGTYISSYLLTEDNDSRWIWQLIDVVRGRLAPPNVEHGFACTLYVLLIQR